jgi:hypothetical protein
LRKPRTAPAEGAEHVEHAPQVTRLRQVAPEGGASSSILATDEATR